MSTAPAPQNALPDESGLLVPFESQNIPDEYGEYYATKRNNFFASIQGFPELWNCYILLDRIWMREFDDVRTSAGADRVFPLILFFNAHAKVRISFELALSGCLSEAHSILRDAVEFVAHAHRLLCDPQLHTVWLGKMDGQIEGNAFRQAFEANKKFGLFKGLGELHEKWKELSETGSHASPLSICDRFVIKKLPDGSQEWGLNYCGVEPRMWRMSLFSFLLTCFVMEQTLFNDYYSRLKLDSELVRMRQEFEQYKEQLRELIKVQYKLKPPSAIHAPRPVIYKP